MSEFRRRLMMSALRPTPPYPDPWVDDGYIWAYYNVTTTEEPTTLLYNADAVQYYGENFIIDGVSVPRTQTYQFDTTGEHLVKMTRSGNLPGSSFRSLSTLKRLYLPDTITGINAYAIYGNANLTHLWLSEEITAISYYGCASNTGLLQVNLYLPKLTTLGNNGSHTGHHFSSSYMPKGVVDFPLLSSIGAQGMFYNTKIVEVKNLGSITTLPRTNGSACFASCTNLKKVTLPDTLINIQAYTFDGATSLTDINFPTSIKTIGAYAFRNCKITGDLNLPELTSISYGAFQNNRLTSITDLGSVTTFTVNSNNGPFKGNTNLASVILPATLTSMAGRAFDGCTSLRTITCLATTPPTITSTDLPGTSVVRNIYVPAESVEDYKAASYWSSYASKISAIPTT